MSVIANLPVVPNRVLILVRFLKEYRDGLGPDELKELLSPRSLRRTKEDSEDEQGRTIADCVLEEAVLLSVVENAEGGRVRVPIGLQDLDDTGILRHLESILVSPKRADAHGQGQFPFALSWLLTVDPAEGLDWVGNQRHRVERECGEETKGFELTNNRRWQNMVYWARYLGYANRLEVDKSNVVVPDPTAALERHAQAILGERREAPMGEFLTLLGKRSPVFETGEAREAVEGMIKVTAKTERSANLISRSTTLALLRLERRRLIRLERRSDADALRLGSWPDERPISHVSLQG